MPTRFFLPTRFHFGQGALKELNKYVNSEDKVFLVTDQGLKRIGLVSQVTDLIESIGASCAVYDDVEPNPRAKTVHKAYQNAKEFGTTIVVTVGGGSPMDVAKVVSMLLTNDGNLEDYQWQGKTINNRPLPLIAVPTTAGTGSELTRTAVIVDRDTKKGIANDALFPAAALVDPELMVSMPPPITAATGMDALTHAIEAYVGLGSNPITDSWALEAIELLVKYLPKAYANGNNLEARDKVALASSLAGAAMDQAGLGIIHAMSGPLSSHYDVPHGLGNAVLLPWGMAFNLIAVPEKMATIAKIFGIDPTGISVREVAQAAVEAVTVLCEDLAIPQTLENVLRDEADIEKFAEEALKMFLMRNNPRKPNLKDCVAIYQQILLAD